VHQKKLVKLFQVSIATLLLAPDFQTSAMAFKLLPWLQQPFGHLQFKNGISTKK